MKYMKMLGLAAVAAMALTAAFGASSTSATVLCTTTSTPCGSGWHVDELVLSLTSGVSLVTSTTPGSQQGTCTSMSVRGAKSVTGSSTTTPVWTVAKTDHVLGNCSQTTHTLAGGEIELHHIAGTHNGTVTFKGFEVTKIIGGVSCIYGAGAGVDVGVLTGGHNAALHETAILNKVGGSFLCPAETVLTAPTLRITNHTNVYVVAS